MNEKISDAEMEAISDNMYHFGEIEGWMQPRINCAFEELLSLRSLNARLVEMCNYFAEWLENVHIDYSNGNVAPNGMDEGDVLGWRGHRELIKQHTALMKEIGG